MGNVHDKHNADFALKLAQDSVTTDPIAPDIFKFSLQLLTPLPGIVSARNSIIKIVNDPFPGLGIEFLELIQGSFSEFISPAHAWLLLRNKCVRVPG